MDLQGCGVQRFWATGKGRDGMRGTFLETGALFEERSKGRRGQGNDNQLGFYRLCSGLLLGLL